MSNNSNGRQMKEYSRNELVALMHENTANAFEKAAAHIEENELSPDEIISLLRDCQDEMISQAAVCRTLDLVNVPEKTIKTEVRIFERVGTKFKAVAVVPKYQMTEAQQILKEQFGGKWRIGELVQPGEILCFITDHR